MDSVENLQKRIAQLEQELLQERNKNAGKREKIDKMSAEVVDSNPYRFVLCPVEVFRSLLKL